MAKEERNLGLLGGQDPELIELVRESGLVTDATSLSGATVAICALCHFARGLEVSGNSIRACTGVNQNTYAQLAKWSGASLISESSRQQDPRAAWYPDTKNYTSSSSTVTNATELMIERIPIRCREVRQ